MNKHLVRIFGGIRVTDLDDFWGVVAPNGQKQIQDLAFARRSPVEPGGAAAMDVNGFRSEPGYTRLSQDDGSIQSKLPQIINYIFFLLYYIT